MQRPATADGTSGVGSATPVTDATTAAGTAAGARPVAPVGIRQLRYQAPSGSTSILLIRHGESLPADPERPFALLDGQGDPPLDSVGREQAELIARRLADQPIRAIYVSTLRRTSETAAPLAARLGIEPVTDPDLREVNLGEWEGGLYRVRVREGHPLARKAYAEQRWDVIPGAEADVDFTRRVRGAIERIARRHPDELVAVFTHGGVIAKLLAEATGSRPFAFVAADNGSISRLVVHGETWVVRSYNDTAHLRPGLGDA